MSYRPANPYPTRSNRPGKALPPNQPVRRLAVSFRGQPRNPANTNVAVTRNRVAIYMTPGANGGFVVLYPDMVYHQAALPLAAFNAFQTSTNPKAYWQRYYRHLPAIAVSPLRVWTPPEGYELVTIPLDRQPP